MSESLTVKEAAKEIGCNPQYLRERMQEGIWDLGTCVKPKGNKTFRYYVFRTKLDKFLGKV